MKKLVVFLFFMPMFAIGQKFEISEMGGYSKELTTVFNGSGFSNEVSGSYYFTRHFSLGVLYGINSWNPQNYAVGLISEFHSGLFYFGADVSYLHVNTFYTEQPPTFTAGGTLSPYRTNSSGSPILGLHFGLNQKISKHIFIKEQIGINYSSLKDVATSEYSDFGFTTSQHFTSFNTLYYANVLVGVSYRFNLTGNRNR